VSAVVEVYDRHDYLPEKRVALNKWGWTPHGSIEAAISNSRGRKWIMTGKRSATEVSPPVTVFDRLIYDYIVKKGHPRSLNLTDRSLKAEGTRRSHIRAKPYWNSLPDPAFQERPEETLHCPWKRRTRTTQALTIGRPDILG
jgi:hypothetical protein